MQIEKGGRSIQIDAPDFSERIQAMTRLAEARRRMAEVQRYTEVIAFCTVAAIGSLLLSMVLVTGVNYFYPLMFFIALSSVAYNRFAVDSESEESLEDSETSQTTVASSIDPASSVDIPIIIPTKPDEPSYRATRRETD